MIEPISLSQLAVRHGGVLFQPDCLFQQVSTDTRSIESGDLFVALRGPNFDANDFLQNAQSASAAGVVAERRDSQLKLPQLVVDDSLKALADLAAMNREKFTGDLIALTGSNGKTTVKEMLRSILSRIAGTHATQGNLNNHIGVPLTLLRIGATDRYSVIEMGASGLDEIAPLSQLARPQVALVNNVGPAHLEGFGTVENVRLTKGGIYSGLSETGTAVVNRDCASSASYLRELEGTRVLTFSANGDSRADVAASEIVETGEGVQFQLRAGDQTAQVRLKVFGAHNVANALAAAACTTALQVPLQQIVDGLAAFDSVAGRLKLYQLVGGAELIDDSYNANPASMNAAIQVLSGRIGRKILVIGDMGELGPDARRVHADVGSKARDMGIDALYAVGEMSKLAVDAFAEGGCHFQDRSELIAALYSQLSPDQVILVKGSRSARMDEVVDALLAEEVSCSTG